MASKKFYCILYIFISFKICAEFEAITHDSLDQVDTGNWYEKLQWWKKSKPKYEQIKHQLGQIKAYQKIIMQRKEAVLTNLYNYLKSLHIDQSKFTATLNKALADLKKELESISNTTDESQAKIVQLADTIKAVESVGQNSELIFMLKSRLDNAIDVLNRLISQSENFQLKALDSFEKIENVLDDQVARSYYEIIENAAENLGLNLIYISETLTSYIENINSKIESIEPVFKKEIEDLEQRGIILRELPEKKKIEEAKIEKKGKEEKKSWWQNIKDFFVSIFLTIKNFILNIFGFGEKEVKDSKINKAASALKA